MVALKPSAERYCRINLPDLEAHGPLGHTGLFGTQDDSRLPFRT